MEDGQEFHSRGVVTQRPMVEVNHPQSQSYKEAFVQQKASNHGAGATDDADRGGKAPLMKASTRLGWQAYRGTGRGRRT